MKAFVEVCLADSKTKRSCHAISQMAEVVVRGDAVYVRRDGSPEVISEKSGNPVPVFDRVVSAEANTAFMYERGKLKAMPFTEAQLLQVLRDNPEIPDLPDRV